MQEPARYEIRVDGHVGAIWFEGLAVRHTASGQTVIAGLMDQAALHGVLAQVRDLGLTLAAVRRVEGRR